MCWGFVLRSVGESGVPFTYPISPARLMISNTLSPEDAGAGIMLSSTRRNAATCSGERAPIPVRKS
jgi:hypothetical protein